MRGSPPLGIIILAILEVIMGLGWLGLGGAVLTAAGAVALGVPVVGLLLGGIILMVAVIMILLGLLSFLLAWGLWMGHGWARLAAITLAVIGIIVGLLTIPGGLLGILINIVIIYYLTRPHVKTYFR